MYLNQFKSCQKKGDYQFICLASVEKFIQIWLILNKSSSIISIMSSIFIIVTRNGDVISPNFFLLFSHDFQAKENM